MKVIANDPNDEPVKIIFLNGKNEEKEIVLDKKVHEKIMKKAIVLGVISDSINK